MAISRKSIRSILENDELDTDGRTKQLLDLLHGETDSLMDKNAELQDKLTEANKAKETAEQGKTDAENALSTYKADQAEQSTKAAKAAAYKQLLKDAGISEKRIDSVARVADLSEIELDKSGKIKGADKLTESIKADWADFVVEQKENGADVPNPPDHQNTYTSKAEILAIADTAERQKAIAENMNLFR